MSNASALSPALGGRGRCRENLITRWRHGQDHAGIVWSATGQAVELAGPTSFRCRGSAGHGVCQRRGLAPEPSRAIPTGAVPAEHPVTLAEAVTMLVQAVGWGACGRRLARQPYLKTASAKGITGGLTYLASDEAAQAVL